jgi:hypothetical protein
MAAETSINDLADMAVYEYLDIAHHCLISGKPGGGCYGYPTALLLLSIVKTIGSYHKGDANFVVEIEGVSYKIDGDEAECYRVLNSPYYNQKLTLKEIEQVYDFYKCLSVHNPAVPKPHFLAIGTPIDTMFSRDKKGKIAVINLVPFYNICVKAVSEFLLKASR